MGDSRIEKLATAALSDVERAREIVKELFADGVAIVPPQYEVTISDARPGAAALAEIADWSLKAIEALRLARVALQPCRCPRTRFRHTSMPPQTRCVSCRFAIVLDNLLRTDPA